MIKMLSFLYFKLIIDKRALIQPVTDGEGKGCKGSWRESIIIMLKPTYLLNVCL